MELAVQVRNACKSYRGNCDNSNVLDNLNLNVKSGSIYGLLGASGCGKTTLLSCIVTLRKLDSGDILVFGKNVTSSHAKCEIPGIGVGFMPQETALFPIFTIRETLNFYGSVYGMDNTEIRKRVEFLKTFLELPKLTRLIQHLSGGQLRRVSLAVAMLHEPPLLILDEPTVGIDPLLRLRIWEHLVKLVKTTATTIIITTHYVEEARSCDRIGVMRRGRLIAEDDPETLILQNQENDHSLENAVLKLCRQDETNCTKCLNTTEIKNDKELKLWPNSVKIPKNNNLNENSSKQIKSKSNHFSIICALVMKTIIMLVRHPLIIGAQLLLPLIQILLYNTIVGTEPFGLKVALVGVSSKDVKYCSRMSLKSSMNCFDPDEPPFCGFINEFEEGELVWVPMSSEDKALNEIAAGEIIGFLNFPLNFSSHFKDRLVYRNNAGNSTLLGSTISVRMDYSNALSSTWLTQKLLKRYSTFVKKIVTHCGIDSRTAQPPLSFHSIYDNGFAEIMNTTDANKLNFDIEDEQNWIQFIQPSLIIAMMYILANISGIVLALENRLGISSRGFVAGIKIQHILTSQLISDSVVILSQIGILFSVLPLFYGMRVRGSWALAVLQVYGSCISGLATGLLLGTFASHEVEVIMVLMLINSLNIISCGGMWPLEGIPKFYRIFCQFLPVTLPIDGLRGIMFRGWGVSHYQVWRGFASSLIWIFVSFGFILLFSSKRWK